MFYRVLLFLTVAACTASAPAQIVAYTFPRVEGNQFNFSGSLGMDFDVNTPITVTALGVFDSGQNGFQNQINARLYDRRTQQSLASLTWSPSLSGYGIDGSVFRDLSEPLLLPAGFQGSIVAEGYGILERNGNSNQPNLNFGTLNDGGGAISFVGSSRHGSFGAFPTNPDVAVAKYGAGTFRFAVVPEPATMGALAVGLWALVRRSRLKSS